ncbi:MAG TPA: hypothetical protein VK586_17810 [Streptosporangiaceae bacterium]|nr:hypothetical protein [Streptosporangiaceae bacterium]
MSDIRMTILIVGLLLTVAAAGFGITAICIDRREKPQATRPGQHTRRGLRRAARAARRAEDDQTIAWLAGLKRRVPAAAIARARVAGLLAVLPDRRDREPRCGAPGCGARLDAGCAHITPAHLAGWATAPGPWDTGEARAELVPLPPMADPVDLARLARDYADLFGRAGPPEPDVTIVDLTVVPPPGLLDEFRARFAVPPGARAGYWQPRAVIEPKFTDGVNPECECTCGWPADWADRGALAVPDFDPATDPPGWGHLAYPWADQAAADFDRQAVARG